MYPNKIIDKIIKSYLNKKLSNENLFPEEAKTCAYFKLPYIGHYSNVTKKKLHNLYKKLCKKDNTFCLVFSSFKIKSMFSAKDSLPSHLKCNVVYKFSCASCNACYIGETTRHFSKRVDEHTKDKKSHIFKHLNSNPDCKIAFSTNCFSILDSAPTQYQLKIKEGLYIGWEKPSLNVQVKHLSSTLT